MTHKQLNRKLLFSLLAGLGLCAAAVVLVHAWQAQRHARTLRAQAQRAEEEGRPDRAAMYLQRYLVFAPDDVAALTHFGELTEQMATSPHERWRAVAVYEQVLYREPSRHDVRRRLALLAAQLGWFTEAREHLEVLLGDRPDQADLEALLGLCREQAGDHPQAVAAYRSAIRHAPDRVDVYQRLAGLLEGPLDEPRRASAVLDDLVRANPRSVEAHLTRALSHLRHGRLQEAADASDRARALAPDDPRLLLTAAELADRLGRPDEARRYLEHGIQHGPRDPSMHLGLATLELRRGRTAAAVADLRRGLEALPGQPDLLGLLAETLVARGELGAAGEVIGRLRRPGAPAGLAHYLDGLVLAKKKDWPAAVRTLEEVGRSAEVAPALAGRAWLALGQCRAELGDEDRRLEALRRAVERTPDSAPARLVLAEALAAGGRADEALEQYREAVQRPRESDEGWVPLGRLLVRRNRGLPPRKRQWAEVERVLERAARLPTQEVPVLVLRAEVLAARDRPEQARALLEQAVAGRPRQAALWAALADLALAGGEPARAALVLAEARGRLGERAELCAAELDLCSAYQARTARETLRGLEKGLDAFAPDEQARLLGRLASAYYRLGESVEGRRLCRKLAGRAPADLGARLLLLDVALQGGDETLLGELVPDVRRLEGEEGTWWRYGEASRLVLAAQRGERSRLAAARALVQDLARRRPDWSRAALLEAYVLELDGEPGRAADAYLSAFNRGERRPGVVERLVRLLADRGRLDDADEVVRKVQQQAALPAELARLGAEVALRQRNADRARELARLAVPADSKDCRRHVWYGQVLTLAGRPAEAEEALRRAVELRGDLAETWVALVAHLARADRADEADEAMAAMARQLPAGQAPLALAVCCEALGRVGAADGHYREALKRGPDDGLALQRAAHFYLRVNRPAEAEPLLRRMLAADADLPSASQAWARRELALLLAYGGVEDRYREALSLLEGAPADARTRAFLQAARPEGRRDALRALEASAGAQPLTAEELFRLVQLYEAEEDVTRAREEMLNVLALDHNNPEYLAHHVGSLLRRGKTDEARPWIARLEKLEPDSSRVQAFRASLLRPRR